MKCLISCKTENYHTKKRIQEKTDYISNLIDFLYQHVLYSILYSSYVNIYILVFLCWF